MAYKKMGKINKLTGDVPYIYKPTTIYTMGILINALVDAVNYLAEQVEKLQKDGEDND